LFLPLKRLLSMNSPSDYTNRLRAVKAVETGQ